MIEVTRQYKRDGIFYGVYMMINNMEVPLTYEQATDELSRRWNLCQERIEKQNELYVSNPDGWKQSVRDAYDEVCNSLKSEQKEMEFLYLKVQDFYKEALKNATMTLVEQPVAI